LAVSVFDLFKSGIGPSSSHTVGPMIAAREFVLGLASMSSVKRIQVELYGSLGATGKGHGSDKAILLGLQGESPKDVDVDKIPELLQTIRDNESLNLPDNHMIDFSEADDLVMHKRKSLPFHPNAMMFTAFGIDEKPIEQRTYYSVGGGFVIDDTASPDEPLIKADDTKLPYAFSAGDKLLELCNTHSMSISDIMRANENVWRSDDVIRDELLALWNVMDEVVRRQAFCPVV